MWLYSTNGTINLMYLLFTSNYKITSWKYSWNGVWTLVLLQYSHVVHTSISILNCPAIPEQEGDTTRDTTHVRMKS